MTQDIAARFEGINKSYDGRTLIVRDLDLDIRRGRIPDAARSLGVRQDDLSADARRIRDADLRRRSTLTESPSPRFRRIGVTSVWCSRTTPCFRI